MTTSSLSYRPLTLADADAVAALIRSAFASFSPPLVPPPSALRETAQSVAAHLQSGGGMVAEADGRVVGCLLWGAREGGLYAGRLAVDADWQRRGIAGTLVAGAEAEARACGLPALLMAVRLALPGNRRLFAGLGFRETTLHAHDGYNEPTWVDLEKRLD